MGLDFDCFTLHHIFRQISYLRKKIRFLYACCVCQLRCSDGKTITRLLEWSVLFSWERIMQKWAKSEWYRVNREQLLIISHNSRFQSWGSMCKIFFFLGYFSIKGDTISHKPNLSIKLTTTVSSCCLRYKWVLKVVRQISREVVC